jgi:hypothetical protein
MNSPASPTPSLRQSSPSRQIQLGSQNIVLDGGGVLVATCPDAALLANELEAADPVGSLVIRYVGGALIGDLSLKDNLMLEASLLGGSLPEHMLPEIDTLFEHAGYPVDWPRLDLLFPESADGLSALQVRIGRALLADPDLLLVNAAEWDEELISCSHFSHSFKAQYPWRSLVWAAPDEAYAERLRESLRDLHA